MDVCIIYVRGTIYHYNFKYLLVRTVQPTHVLSRFYDVLSWIFTSLNWYKGWTITRVLLYRPEL